MSLSEDVGYEEAVVTPTARVWSWILLLFLLVGVYGGALIGGSTGTTLMNWDLRIAFFIVLIGYIVFSRKSVASGVGRVVWGLPAKSWPVIILMVVMNLLNSLYAVLDTPLWGLHSVESHWDQYVPTIPVFVLPYLGLYVVLFATQGFLGFRLLHRQLLTFLTALALAMGTALITFVLFQTYVATGPDDEAMYGQPIVGPMLEFVNNDWYGAAWYSAFPSMHCGFATVFAFAWYRRRKPLWSTLMILLCVAIVIATQVLHEHVLMDALFGIVTATAAYSAAWFWCEYAPARRRERREAVGELVDSG